jgi:hypothetical protein
LFRQRSQAALKQKARCGALVLGVAAGYVKADASGSRRIRKRVRCNWLCRSLLSSTAASEQLDASPDGSF